MIMGSSDILDWETRLAEATQKENGITAGVVLAAVDKNGDFIYNKAAGLQSLEPDAPPISEDGIMWIASCTKLITSICALQCVERGQITLDEPLATHLPELAADPQVVALDDASSLPAGGFTLRPARNPVTLRTLLTHTSGNAYEWGDERLAAWRKANPLEKQYEGLMPHVYRTPLLFDPGEGWVYGGGLDWAGILVSRLNNTTLEQYFEQHIFQPLSMHSTTFHLDKRPDLRARLVPCSERTPDGGLKPMKDMVYHESVPDQSGGGGLWSCASDYIKLLADLTRDTPTLLKRATVTDLLAKPQLTNEQALRGLLANRGATAANASPAEAGLNYGLGGMVLTKASPFLPEGSLCWGGLPNLKWFVHPRRQVAALYFQQIMPPGDAKSAELAGCFFQEVFRLHEIP